MGISARVRVEVDRVSVPSCCPASTGASTSWQSVTVLVTPASSPFSMRMGAVCCSTGVRVDSSPRITRTGCSGSSGWVSARA